MSQREQNPFRLLMNKSVYEILDGDTKFEDYEFSDDFSTIKISMPYLSGPALCQLSTLFGLPMTYTWGGVNLSRWQYLEKLFTHCIKEDRCSELLAHLFGRQQFSTMFAGHEANAIDSAYTHFVQTIIGKINGTLYFGGNELVAIDDHFIVRKIGAKVEV